VSGRPPTEHCPLPTRPDRREIPSLKTRRPMPDAIDRGEFQEQPTYGQALPDLPERDTRAQ
jgi:hypothetical protein